MSRSAHADRDSLGRMFSYTSYLLGVASLPICLLISMCATPLIVATAGPEFVEAAGALRLLIWATPVIFLNAQLRFVLTALDAERRYWQLITQALALKICLGLVLIPLWGLYGACVSNLLGELGLCAMGLGVLRLMGITRPSWLQFLRVVPAACAMALVLLPFSGSNVSLGVLVIAALVSTIVFGGMCLLCGVWPWSDVMRVWGVFRRSANHAKTMRGARGPLGSEASEAALNYRS